MMMKNYINGMKKTHLIHMLLAGALCMSVLAFVDKAIAYAQNTNPALKDVLPGSEEIQKKWGIQLVAMRMTAADHMLDFRYKVLDGKKASELFKRENKPFALHQKSGKALTVQNTAKIGPLRNTNTPKEGRTYWMFFRNYRGLVDKGDKVTVKIGDFRVENIVVE